MKSLDFIKCATNFNFKIHILAQYIKLGTTDELFTTSIRTSLKVDILSAVEILRFINLYEPRPFYLSQNHNLLNFTNAMHFG